MKKIILILFALITLSVNSQTRRMGSFIFAEDGSATFSKSAPQGTIVFDGSTNRFYRLTTFTPQGTTFNLSNRIEILGSGSGGGTSNTLYNSNGTLLSNTVATITDSLTFSGGETNFEGNIKVSDTLSVDGLIRLSNDFSYTSLEASSSTRENIAKIQDTSGTLAYLHDIPTAPEPFCLLSFDGVNKSVSVTDASFINSLQGSLEKTINFFYTPLSGQTKYLLQGNGNSNRGIYIAWSTGQIAFRYMKDGTGSTRQVIFPDNLIIQDQNNYLSFSLNTVLGFVQLKVNGVEVAPTTSTIFAGDNVHINTTPITFGGGSVSGFTNLAGNISRVSVIDKIISLSDHIAVYNDGNLLNAYDYYSNECSYLFNASDAVFENPNFTITDDRSQITATSINMIVSDKACDSGEDDETTCSHNLIFGGAIDQSAELQQIIDDAPDYGYIELCGGKLLIQNPIVIDKPITINHFGVTLLTTTDSPIYQFGSNEISILGSVEFVGSNNSGQTNQIGINVGDYGKFKIIGASFSDNYKGISVGNGLVLGAFLPSIVTNIYCYNNTYGYYGEERSEYVNISSSIFDLNTTGIENKGGNLNINACIIYRGNYGLRFLDGANNAHGIINGCEINHQVLDAIYIEETIKGQTISNNHIFQGGIHLKNCQGINISGGIMDLGYLRLENTTGVRISNVTRQLIHTNTIDKAYNGASPSTIIQYNNYTINGTEYLF